MKNVPQTVEISHILASNYTNEILLLLPSRFAWIPRPHFILCILYMQEAVYSLDTVHRGQIRAPLPRSVLCVKGRKRQIMREHTVQVYMCMCTIVLHLLFCISMQGASGSRRHSEWWELWLLGFSIPPRPQGVGSRTPPINEDIS